jgi:circadian clock protein KaiC
MNEPQKTGIEGLDALIGGIPRGSRNILVGPPGAGKTTFAMQFLWTGLRAGETVSFDSIDRPWTHVRAQFLSLGWDIRPFEESRRFFAIQAYPHFDPYPRDPHVRYFDLPDFSEMKAIDLELSEQGVSRFAAGDTLEHMFTELDEDKWREIEDWTINWCHHDQITNIDTMSEVEERDPVTRRMKDYSFYTAHDIFRFRVREVDGRMRRELRIEKMEGVSHPLDWMPFEIAAGGIRLL